MINEELITQLYQELTPKLIGWLIKRQVSQHQAEDLAQDAFIRVWSHRETIRDNREEVIGLIWRIIKNLFVDQYRHSRYEVLTDDAEKISDAYGASTSTGSHFDAEIIAQRMTDALAAMPAEQAEAWRLMHISHASVKEISAKTGASETLVKVRVFRAKKRLQAALVDTGYEFDRN